ncbi:MAG: hypothetical protein LBV04_02760 [Deferribacteraceae bacterium]|jgi:TPR repeat protein|nr:hypothetical protein [Deferribacteraceae bacterium]
MKRFILLALAFCMICVTQNAYSIMQADLVKAEQGDAHAQNNLGNMYYQGKGVPQNYAKAMEWYTKAAVQGYAHAQNNLGTMYGDGTGVSQDYAKAVGWYTKAAEQGNAAAQKNLGYAYEIGQGISQDYAKAMEWYTKSAEQGFADAQNNLGTMYENSRGVPQNYDKAIEWYTKAAEQGNVYAQTNLGNMYYQGKGMPQNYAKAMELYTKAAEQKYARAQLIITKYGSNHKALIDLFTQLLTQLTNQSGIGNNKSIVVAVLPLMANQALASSADYFTQYLSYATTQYGNWTAVERNDLQKILDEHAIQLSELTEGSTELGGLLGAQILISGVLYEKDGNYELYIKMLHVESGELFAMSSIMIDKSFGVK